MISVIKDGVVLQSFTPGKLSVLTVDASDYGLGAVLEQDEKPVIFISRRLSKSERNYAQTQKEALAIVWSLERLHKYLYGLKFVINTDHKPLQYILNPSSSLQKSTSAMIQRWAIKLAAYNYEIRYVPGVKIPNADYLTRFS